MTINLSLPVTHELKPKITVIGVGGAGGNAVNNMITSHLEGVDFVACNTDAQALANTLTEHKIQLGNSITRGLGAGARPEVGAASAEESLEEILDSLDGSNMVFICGGMGGGTGTGAMPVIAREVRKLGILTVGVVTKPFHFEGAHRMRLADGGLGELQKHVDTLIVIPNQNLFRLANEQTTFADAFKLADEVLHMGVRGVTDLMMMPGLINLDFADIRTVMSEMGKAMMGTGEAEGEKRALDAAEAAISNPLLDEVSMHGAKAVLINITGGKDIALFEVDAAANRIREEVDSDANIIFGSTFDESLNGRIRVSVVATGIDAAVRPDPIEAPVVEEAPTKATGWFPKETHKPRSAKAPELASSAMANPAMGLRAARNSGLEEQRARFAPPIAETAPFSSQEAQMAQSAFDEPEYDDEPRQQSIFDRMKGFAFTRNPQATRPARQVSIEDEPAMRPAVRQTRPAVEHRSQRVADEIGEIPTFLRKQREEA